MNSFNQLLTLQEHDNENGSPSPPFVLRAAISSPNIAVKQEKHPHEEQEDELYIPPLVMKDSNMASKCSHVEEVEDPINSSDYFGENEQEEKKQQSRKVHCLFVKTKGNALELAPFFSRRDCQHGHNWL